MSLMRNLLLVLMWTPMFVLGQVLSSIVFRDRSAASYIFFLLWPCANFFLAYKICQKDGSIIVLRLVSLFFVELAVLIILLRYFANG